MSSADRASAGVSVPVDPFRTSPPRLFAIVATVTWIVVVISFAVPQRLWWIDYVGIVFHLAMFMLVAKLDAPDWAKAAGYGWLVLDVMTGVLTLNNLPATTYTPVRLGGHIFAGTWISVVSLSGSRAIRIVGVVTGLWLAAYTFVSPFVSMKALGPDTILMLVWLAMIVWKDGTGGLGGGPRTASP